MADTVSKKITDDSNFHSICSALVDAIPATYGPILEGGPEFFRILGITSAWAVSRPSLPLVDVVTLATHESIISGYQEYPDVVSRYRKACESLQVIEAALDPSSSSVILAIKDVLVAFIEAVDTNLTFCALEVAVGMV